MIDPDQALSEANKLVELASKKNQSFFGGFFGEDPNEKKVEYLESAASKFLMAQRPDQAAQVYSQLAEIQKSRKVMHEAANFYKKAGEYFRKSDLQSCVRCYREAINIRASSNSIDQAAKILQELGEIYIENNMNDEAFNAYKQSLTYFEQQASTKNSASSCRLKLAELCLEMEKYDLAGQYFYQSAEYCKGQTLLRFSSKNHIFRSVLCLLITNREGAGDKQQVYKEKFPEYTSSREAQLVDNICEAIRDNDEKRFSSKLAEFNQISNPDQYVNKLLTKIKKSFDSADDIC